MAVLVDSGPIEATDKLHQVPRAKWRSLMVARQLYLRTNLSHDCRCLVEFVDDAQQMFEPLGFRSVDEMVRDGYQLSPAEIGVAVEWLRLHPDEAVPFDVAQRLAIEERKRKAQETDAEDQANKSRQGKGPRDDKGRFVDNEITAINERPVGTSRAYALRRLRKDRPDIHARVLAGELSPHGGMVEAGFRKRKQPPPDQPSKALRRILKLLDELSADEIAWLQTNIEILLWQRGDRAA
jgi:hypothetical protein